jgi:uncharacterized membrane protein
VRCVRLFARDERGSIAIIGAVFSICAIAVLAIGVDSASLYLEKRRAQSAADLAAIAAARDPERALAAAQATVSDNGVARILDLRITRGRYTADPALAPLERFAAAPPFNAVVVELTSEAPLYFGRSLARTRSLKVVSRATAVSTASAAFTVGSRLVSLNDGMLNALLGSLLGGSVSLTAMDYNALAGFNVDLFEFSRALGISVAGQAGTYGQLASARVSVAQILDTLIAVARASGAGAQTETALRQLKLSTTASAIHLTVNDLIDFGPARSVPFAEGAATLNARVSALSLLRAAAEVATGAHQADIATALSAPGLLSLSLGITIGERPQASPWLRFGEKSAEVYTAQTRVRLIAEAGGSGLLAGIRLRLPVYVDIAAARARLVDVTCGPNENATAVALAVRPSAVNAWIAEPATLSGWKTLSAPPAMHNASIVTAPLLTATGRANAEITNLADTIVTFRFAEVAALTPRTVRTAHYTSSLVASLMGSLSLNVSVGPLSLQSPALLATAIREQLAPASAAIDRVLHDVLRTFGLGIGEADVWVNGVRCDGAALVR